VMACAYSEVELAQSTHGHAYNLGERLLAGLDSTGESKPDLCPVHSIKSARLLLARPTISFYSIYRRRQEELTS